MTIGEKLTESKTALDALLVYANETTGAGDTNIGEAIKTLVDGYGQGGGVVTLNGTWTAEQLSYRVFYLNHNLGLADPSAHTYIFRMYARDMMTHVFPANNLFVMGVGSIMPTNELDRSGYIAQNGNLANCKGIMTGVMTTFYTGNNAAGSSLWTANDGIGNNAIKAELNRLVIGLGLRGCEAGLDYDWELTVI